MEWSDEGVILGVRRHGESSAVVEVFTRGRGRHMGLVRGGRSKRMQAVLQPGNAVTAVWRARLDEHLGLFALELEEGHAATLMQSSHALYGFAVAAAHLRLLPERDPHEGLHDAFRHLVLQLPRKRQGAADLARFELLLLAEFGFGLDLTSCAVTGTVEDLVWVSPRSGRAVSREAGQAYADRLLKLPRFLLDEEAAAVSAADVSDAFRLTGFFLGRHVLEPRGLCLPPERARLIGSLD
ncbi:DNA repair protein RecO [Lutibaculum baratangense]|uniref:DNA repair protein RecO n=1 Tax=Lutibaculum baratangense AMV1 TaxID=631454 RepID=V4QTY8_9HYPH|nr:DNA repair protein RecO [Lutibaculum baratangense]ESR23242.1 DNA recombination and repair protein RecO [Lutibaculum baratangense AMV1]